MSPFRTMVTTTDERLRCRAAWAFEEAGCEVLPAVSSADCLDRLRDARPDLLVLLPPLRWPAVADVVNALGAEPATRRVPVLILAPVREEPFPRVPRLFMNDPPERGDFLPDLIEWVLARLRG